MKFDYSAEEYFEEMVKGFYGSFEYDFRNKMARVSGLEFYKESCKEIISKKISENIFKVATKGIETEYEPEPKLNSYYLVSASDQKKKFVSLIEEKVRESMITRKDDIIKIIRKRMLYIKSKKQKGLIKSNEDHVEVLERKGFECLKKNHYIKYIRKNSVGVKLATIEVRISKKNTRVQVKLETCKRMGCEIPNLIKVVDELKKEKEDISILLRIKNIGGKNENKTN